MATPDPNARNNQLRGQITKHMTEIYLIFTRMTMAVSSSGEVSFSITWTDAEMQGCYERLAAVLADMDLKERLAEHNRSRYGIQNFGR